MAAVFTGYLAVGAARAIRCYLGKQWMPSCIGEYASRYFMPVNMMPADAVYKILDKVTLSDFFCYLLNPSHCAGL